ncbi:MAG: FRG domain-containing protein [Acidobacteria bacterium]|nr:FRG domain-containing protein [Acidobacteriota bacterium]
MAKVRIEKPTTLPEYIDLVNALGEGAGGKLWFRGCGDSSFELIPSLYRHRSAKKPEDFANLEEQLVTRFKQRSIPYEIRPLSNQWDTLFFMQHYGIPTRLLDWTENPLTGLHFALMSAQRKVNQAGSKVYEHAAAVWVLDPTIWNTHALSRQTYNAGPLVHESEELSGYTWRKDFAGMQRLPVGLYGAHNSPRIVAQQGVFVVFGQDSVPMETLYSDSKFPDDCLIKIEIKKNLIGRLRKALLDIGVTESIMFPDLDGLARETRRIFGFDD